MTAEAKRRKNQKKKLKQKQKKQAEKLATAGVAGPGQLQSQDGESESVSPTQGPGTSNSSNGPSDDHLAVTSDPLEKETSGSAIGANEDQQVVEADHNIVVPVVGESKGPETPLADPHTTDENTEIIKSIQEDTGTDIDEALERRLSDQVTIIDEASNPSSQKDEIASADPNAESSEVEGVERRGMLKIEVPSGEPAVIETIQRDEGSSVGEFVGEKLPGQVTIIDDAPTRAVSEEEKLREADHNIVVPVFNVEAEAPSGSEVADAATNEITPVSDTEAPYQAQPKPQLIESSGQESNVQVVDSEPNSPTVSHNFDQPSSQSSDQNERSLEDSQAATSEADISPEPEEDLRFSTNESFNQNLPEQESPTVFFEEQVDQTKSLTAGENSEGQEPGAGSVAFEQDVSNDQSVKTQASAPSELFTSYSGDDSERMPWETSEANGSDSKHNTGEIDKTLAQTTELFATAEDEEQEKMPWELTTPEGADNMIGASNDVKKVGSEEFEQLHAKSNFERSPNMTTESDNQALPGVNEVPFQENSGTATDDQTSQFEKHNEIENVPKEQANADRLAQIFGDDGSEGADSWLNEEKSGEAENLTSSNDFTANKEDNTQRPATMKFSFLEEDDDLLDENLSDNDSLLPSDDEETFPQQSSKGTIAHASVDSETVANETAQTVTNSTQASIAPSVTSSTSSLQRSKYEPRQPFKPEHQSNAAPTTTYGAPSNIGMVAPQFPFQSIPAQQTNVTETQEVVEKINKEKKKSDAYDFPLDLFPKKEKIAHAKPVGTPSPTVSSVSSHSISMRNSSTSHSGLGSQPPGRDRSISNASLPRNPYATLATASKVKSPEAVQPQGIVPPQLSLPPGLPPAVGQPNFLPIKPQAQTPFSPKVVPRARGFSNASSGNPSAPWSPTWAASQSDHLMPVNPPQPLPTVKKRTTPRYAPSYPPNPQNFYPPASSTKLNGSFPVITGSVPNGSHSKYGPHTTVPSVTLPDPQAQKVNPHSLAVNVPTHTSPNELVSPISASGTRRFHARSNSSVYTPNQTEYTSKYAPTVHPQYQNSVAPQMPQTSGQFAHPQNAGRQGFRNDFNAIVPETEQPVDNLALMHRQFPLIHWSASDKIVYAVPQNSQQNNYLVGPDFSLQQIKIASLESVIPVSQSFKSFPGPLIKNRTKDKDVEKWIESALADYSETTLGFTILSLMKLKLRGNTTWRDISRCLYNSDEMLTYLSQPVIGSKSNSTAQKLDSNEQVKILAYLQIGGQDKALTLALQKGDFAMALLIGSLMGKDKWSEIVQRYLVSEFNIDSDVFHFSTNLLSLVFQVFIGNSKAAVMEFYSVEKSQWACDHWRMIIAAVLNNIRGIDDAAPQNGEALPPVVHEFLVEYGVFLTQRGLASEACAAFIIAEVPLSALPVVDSPVKFTQIGSPTSIEGCIFSEVYEFITCSDTKGYSSLMCSKLYHAFCLQEQGLASAASRYVDHLNSLLKSFPKKDPLSLAIATNLSEFSTRVAGSSTGWLGKPKLSSVWGQLDKSFNKYIGGDDDSLIKKPSDKKVFDGFTPVPSRNSSTLDVSQHNFTPAQNQHYGVEGSIPFAAAGGSPQNANVAVFAPRNPLSRTLTDQGPPTFPSSFSVGSSPKHPQRKQSESTTGSRLRRTRTEQTATVTTQVVHANAGEFPSQKMPNYGVRNNFSSTDLAASMNPPPSAQISRVSPHHSSTPELLPGRSSVLSSGLLPLTSQNFREESTATRTPAPVNTSLEAEPSFHPLGPFVGSHNDLQKPAQSTATDSTNQTPLDMSQFPGREFKNLAEETIRAGETDFVAQGTSVHQAEVTTLHDQELSGADKDFIDDQGETSVIHRELSGQLPGPLVEPGDQARAETASPSEAFVDKSALFVNPYAPAFQQLDGSKSVVDIPENTKIETPQPGLLPGHNLKTSFANRRNPYAPSTAINHVESAEKISDTSDSKSSINRAGEHVNESSPPLVQHSTEPTNDSVSSVADKFTSTKNEEHHESQNRFDPVKPPEALSPENFVPVIKKKPASRAFTPLVVQSPEIQYDDVVEDESDDDDEEEQQRMREKEEEETRKKEEELRRQKEEEKAKMEKSKEHDKAGGWFSWLKKDPNEKKPIKAKLGHKSTFYYDEKLKRWVNKDASQEEKEKIASPPPPPPVVKKMDNGPKTRPLASPEVTTRETAGAVLPKNPITGAALSSPGPSTNSIDNGPQALAPPIGSPNVNLSGKKANGLDDLLSLTGGSTSRRKKKPGRGYVNVMENK